jgi:hypothetical protein
LGKGGLFLSGTQRIPAIRFAAASQGLGEKEGEKEGIYVLLYCTRGFKNAVTKVHDAGM